MDAQVMGKAAGVNRRIVKRGGKLVAALLALSAHAAVGQTYPVKPVSLFIAYNAGGAIDLPLRLILPRLSTNLGQPVLMVHRPGGGGTIATDAVIANGADGYTLLVNGDQFVTSPHLMGKLVRYDVFRDLVPITRMVTLPFALVVNPSVPANTLAEFLALAKSGKAKLSYGSPGNGTSNHLSMEYFKSLTGAQILHVPYKGAVPAITDLLAGRIEAILFASQTAAPPVRAGKLRALAMSGAARTPQMPNTPTFGELGMPEFDVGTTFGLLAAAGTPESIVARLHAEFTGALRAPEIRKQIEDTGTIVTADSREEFAKKLRADYERNGRIIRENKIQPE
jgi:tripartite-type tricarboxylate transporter receptor subunit TctC